jgi:hypothetical protein
MSISSTLDDDSIPERVVAISTSEEMNPARLNIAIDMT